MGTKRAIKANFGGRLFSGSVVTDQVLIESRAAEEYS